MHEDDCMWLKFVSKSTHDSRVVSHVIRIHLFRELKCTTQREHQKNSLATLAEVDSFSDDKR